MFSFSQRLFGFQTHFHCIILVSDLGYHNSLICDRIANQYDRCETWNVRELERYFWISEAYIYRPSFVWPSFVLALSNVHELNVQRFTGLRLSLQDDDGPTPVRTKERRRVRQLFNYALAFIVICVQDKLFPFNVNFDNFVIKLFEFLWYFG